jgi:hypothetical protein
MKELNLTVIVLCVVGCSGAHHSVTKKSKESSAYEQTVRGEQLEDAGQYRIDRDLLARYRQAITENANELLLRSDPGNDLFHVTEVEIESVFLGDPSIIGARVSGVVDMSFQRWRLMHPEGNKAEYYAHYIFGPNGQYQGVRNADLVRVWN